MAQSRPSRFRRKPWQLLTISTTTAWSSSSVPAPAAVRWATNWRRRASTSSCSNPARGTNTRTSSTTSGTVLPSSPGSITARRGAAGEWRRTSRTCRPGSSRQSAAPPPTGPAPRCASRSMSSGRSAITARSTAPTCSTGRSRSPSWSPITPRPKTRWASPEPTASRACRATTTSRSSRPAPTSSAIRNVTPATWRSTPPIATTA